MQSRGINNKSSISIAIVVAIVLIASVLIILRPMPEQVIATSQDGLVQVDGVTRASGALQIDRLDGVQTSIENILSPVYQISFGDDGVLEDAEVVMAFNELGQEEVSIQDATIYQFDRTTLSWQALPTFFDLSEGTLSASLTLSGSVMVGVGARSR
jgi:hypothetical protein